jgi:hypothetical protein
MSPPLMLSVALFTLVLLSPIGVQAADQTSVRARIAHSEYEWADEKPVRMRIEGIFSFQIWDSPDWYFTEPKAGYLYYACPEGVDCTSDWQEILDQHRTAALDKACVMFGHWGDGTDHPRIRDCHDAPSEPDEWTGNYQVSWIDTIVLDPQDGISVIPCASLDPKPCPSGEIGPDAGISDAGADTDAGPDAGAWDAGFDGSAHGDTAGDPTDFVDSRSDSGPTGDGRREPDGCSCSSTRRGLPFSILSLFAFLLFGRRWPRGRVNANSRPM